MKVVGIPGGYTKIEEKPWISRGVNAKNGKFQGNHGKFEWKSREVNFKKLDIFNRGGGTISFWKSPILDILLEDKHDTTIKNALKAIVNNYQSSLATNSASSARCVNTNFSASIFF